MFTTVGTFILKVLLRVSVAGGVLYLGALFYTFFWHNSVPKSYSECMNTHTNDYSQNTLRCSFSPRSWWEYRTCEQKNGVYDQFNHCLIAYHNPAFVFPKNLTECVSSVGYIDMNKTTCDISLDEHGAYDITVLSGLVDQCLQNGGMKTSAIGCSKRFASHEGGF